MKLTLHHSRQLSLELQAGSVKRHAQCCFGMLLNRIALKSDKEHYLQICSLCASLHVHITACFESLIWTESGTAVASLKVLKSAHTSCVPASLL